MTGSPWAVYLAIAAGGAVGSVLRFSVQQLVERRLGPSLFPAGTFAVNIAGCFLIGLLTALLFGPWPLREAWRAGLVVGVLGGFTTFSSFGLESFRLIEAGHPRMALLYMLASGLGGLVSVWLGARVVQTFLR